MKIAASIFIGMVISLFIYLKVYKDNGIESLKNKYGEKINERPIQQVMNNVYIKTSKLTNITSSKSDEEKILKQYQAKINNEILYKDKLKFTEYFDQSTESQELMNLAYSKFHLKDNKNYFKYKSAMLKKIASNSKPYAQEMKNIISKMPIAQHPNEKREMYELANMFISNSDNNLKDIIISDITSIPSKAEIDNDAEHTKGDAALSAESEALYQSVRLYKKLFKDGDSVAKLKSVIKSTQKNNYIRNNLLSLISLN